jgi:Acetyltransferase (GNAT) domain
VTGKIEYFTTETESGRLALQEVMKHSYSADIAQVPAQWALARVVDGVPVSFILVDPDRQMSFSGGDVRYGYICDVATREDRRREGHFQAIMEHVFFSLRASGIPLVLTHGRYPLYRRFGFDVFTHHSGIFVTPGQIERTLGMQDSGNAQQLLTFEDNRYVHDDLLLVVDIRARTVSECKAALQTVAAVARERGKTRILFEHPTAPSYGSRYPIYPSLETSLTTLARTCGAQICIQGADPESGSIPDADWIKVLDAAGLVRCVLDCLDESDLALSKGTVCLDTDAGTVIIESLERGIVVSDEMKPGAIMVNWPSSALAQLVIGYRTAQALCAIHNISLPVGSLSLLQALFPGQWRLSRNESWTFKS